MKTPVALVGFEPAIQNSLLSLLRGEPDINVVSFPPRWHPLDELPLLSTAPVVLIGASWTEEFVTRLTDLFPRATYIWQGRWTRPEVGFQSQQFFDYKELVRLVRASAMPPPSGSADGTEVK